MKVRSRVAGAVVAATAALTMTATSAHAAAGVYADGIARGVAVQGQPFVMIDAHPVQTFHTLALKNANGQSFTASRDGRVYTLTATQTGQFTQSSYDVVRTDVTPNQTVGSITVVNT